MSHTPAVSIFPILHMKILTNFCIAQASKNLLFYIISLKKLIAEYLYYNHL